MVITRTPFRLSFFGGGTDFEDYYKNGYGCVVSTSIDKYIYITVNKRFDGKIHLRYSEIEEVENIKDLRHSIVRECLKQTGVYSGVEIVSISDIPAQGSGLGSSSAFTVGLLNALYTYKGAKLDPTHLAKLACEIEINLLKAPIGRQDQYACALGGLKYLSFNYGNKVEDSNLYYFGNHSKIQRLKDESMLFYLGFTRNANETLQGHKDSIYSKKFELDRLKEMAEGFRNWIIDTCEFFDIGGALNKSWEIKKELSSCSNPYIDKIIIDVQNAGADGVKLVGAGNGGFMLVICKKANQEKVRSSLAGLQELKFNFETGGTQVIYNDRLH